MRVLRDEWVDWRLLRDLAGHDIKTARQMGWSEVKNGIVLRLAADHVDVVASVDRKLSFQNEAGQRTGHFVQRLAERHQLA